MDQKKPNRYRPIWKSEFKLPEKYKMAAWIIINVEYFEYSTPYPADPSDIVPNVLNYGWRDYGTRVGIWRKLDILDKYEIKTMMTKAFGQEPVDLIVDEMIASIYTDENGVIDPE